MASERRLVSLKLQSGDTFDNVPVENTESTLAEFLDQTLKTLEDESRIQLPDTEEELVDSKHFKIYNEEQTILFDLSNKLSELSYLVQCWEEGKTPVIYLISDIFRNAHQVQRDERGNMALRRQSAGTSPDQLQPPDIPDRTTSMDENVSSKDTILFMAGRKPYTGRAINRTSSPTESTSSVDLYPSNEGELIERIFDASNISLAPSEDSLSVASQGTAYSTKSSEPSKRMSPLVHDERADDGAKITRTHSQSATRPESPGTPEGNNISRTVSEKMQLSRGGSHHRPVRSTKSLPSSSTNIVVSDEVSLPQIKEGEEMSISEKKRMNRGSRESSPGMLERPTSPDHKKSSPSSSPRVSKKMRLASKRRTKHRLTVEDGLEAGGGDGGSAVAASEGEGQAPSTTSRRHRRTIYAKSRSASMFFPLRVFGNIKTFTVDFEIPVLDIMIQMDIRGNYTIGQIKENLWASIREQGLMSEEFGALWDPENFTFTYKMSKETYELYDEQQIFQTAKVIQLWRSEKRERGLLTVELKKPESKEEKTLNMEIGAMIGIGLYQLQFANNDELDITRRKMVAVRRNAVRSRDPLQYSMEADITLQSLPPSVYRKVIDEKALIRVYYKLGSDATEQSRSGSYQTLQVEVSTTADELIPMCIPDDDMKKRRYGIPVDCDPNNLVLKVAGQNSYLHGRFELIEFAYIAKCLCKKLDVVLALVTKTDFILDKPREVEDWNLIDEATGLTGTHSDLSALTKEHTQVFTMSTWDIQRKFSIRVVGLDNLRNKDCEVIYIEAGIYHGGEVLGFEKFTSEVAWTSYPRWNQWLVFDIVVKNLPKAARLCLQVVGGNRTKDTKRKSLGRGSSRKSIGKEDKKGDGSLDKPLHWVNIQILDHRSLLRQGLLRLNLWPIVPDPVTGISQMSPMGSTAINPDGNNSAVLYIELDTYSHPVAFPTGGWGEDTPIAPEPSTKDASIFKKDLEKAIYADPLTQLDKPQKELIWKFRTYCSTIPEALPKLLRCVDWADLEQVCEVHRLLDVWRPITLDVALELLDYHFADEKVRSLAVRRLEKLANNELQNFLLQLVQVLKFEPYHDSAVARFLLKRALRSKLIGHYFYWYLRSEMDTPEFNQRFGILLEAYLRGCGESTFKELQNQHTAVCSIMRVADSIKKQTDKHKTATELARESLSRYSLPDHFSPPYDPFLSMGGLRISKCKVMDSKKAPLWLEFENKDVTDISGRCIKIIAKHGDDLRQDMLTLQMLKLMDTMWQAHGLDLHIIPYGCIATGNQMGIIQVVQDAETVAKIQLNHGGTFSALKEEPLHDWLKKQNPTQNRFDAAVEMFMLSCAGYCVATYILGIGDRHNDNVMVTHGGNLFHIDFGHFLGNKKFFMGVNRERAPFVFTPDFEYVMGKRQSETFRRFEETAVKAYMIIRKNANVFINLFSMMKCTGIPELRSVEDLDYLRNVLVLNKSPQEAEDHFKAQIQKCLRLQWSTQFNWFTHNIVHSRN